MSKQGINFAENHLKSSNIKWHELQDKPVTSDLITDPKIIFIDNVTNILRSVRLAC